MSHWFVCGPRYQKPGHCAFSGQGVTPQARLLSSDDVDLSGVAELGEELLAIFPYKPERAHICGADSGNGIANGRQVGGVEFILHQRRFRPIDQSSQRQIVTKIGSELFCNRFTGHE